MGEKWKQRQILFFGAPKIIVDSNCSHEIKRCLLFGRKTMTNLDGILKSKHMTLPTKVHIVKAVVFPVVMYGCESCIIKKVERWKTDAFKLWCWRRPQHFESPLDYREIKPVNHKRNQPYIFIGRVDAEAPILWPPDVKSQLIGKDSDAGKDWRQKEKGATENEMVR